MKDNELIAEFMGVGKNYEAQSSNQFNQYHSSWDWLMPVIDKCYQEHMSKHIADAVMTCDIEVVYDRVVEFIKELNK